MLYTSAQKENIDQLLPPAQKFASKFGSENTVVSSNHCTIARQIDQESEVNYRVSSKKCPRIWHLRRGTKNNVSIFIEQHVIEKQRTKNITAHCDIYFDRKQNTVAHQNRGQLSFYRLCYSHLVVIQIVYELKPNTRAPCSERSTTSTGQYRYSKASEGYIYVGEWERGVKFPVKFRHTNRTILYVRCTNREPTLSRSFFSITLLFVVRSPQSVCCVVL
jgi:hypothetical protein